MIITPEIIDRAKEREEEIKRAVELAGLEIRKTENVPINIGLTPTLALAAALELVRLGY